MHIHFSNNSDVLWKCKNMNCDAFVILHVYLFSGYESYSCIFSCLATNLCLRNLFMRYTGLFGLPYCLPFQVRIDYFGNSNVIIFRNYYIGIISMTGTKLVWTLREKLNIETIP